MEQDLVTDAWCTATTPRPPRTGCAAARVRSISVHFLYVDALARAGRLDQARYAFDKMLTYANHVGLFGEEIGPTGEQLGNFPQAFTHLALIFAALALDDALDVVEDDA